MLISDRLAVSDIKCEIFADALLWALELQKIFVIFRIRDSLRRS